MKPFDNESLTPPNAHFRYQQKPATSGSVEAFAQELNNFVRPKIIRRSNPTPCLWSKRPLGPVRCKRPLAETGNFIPEITLATQNKPFDNESLTSPKLTSATSKNRQLPEV